MLCVHAVSPLAPRDTYGLKGGGISSLMKYIGCNGRREICAVGGRVRVVCVCVCLCVG